MIGFDKNRLSDLFAKGKASILLGLVIMPLLTLVAGCNSSAADSHQQITKANLAFIPYPGFPEKNSTWDDIGYNSTYNKVFVAVTNHRNKQMLYVYDADSGKMEQKGIITDLANLRGFQHQGKIHTKLIEGPKGNMFFGTDGGASREEYFMNHPHGYLGGYFMKWDPVKQKLTNLGMGMRFDSLKDVGVAQAGLLYGVSYPQVHFLLYNVDKNRVKDLGRLGSAHVPRVMFTDRWGNAYYVDWRQRLVKYDKSQGRLIFARDSVPAFPGTPGGVIITGPHAYAKDLENRIIYFITYGGKLLALHPQKDGIGEVDDLGGIVKPDMLGPGVKPWRPYTPNLAFGHNGKLYYFVGTEGRYAQKDTVLFMECNPATGNKRILFKFPLSTVSYISGSNVTDKQGNMYFAAMKTLHVDGHRKVVPFMIKFNPTHEVKK